MNDYQRRWDNEKRKWTYLHREIIEKNLCRKLKSDEHVHHIDGNPKNNKIDNLIVVSKAEHTRLHKPAKKETNLCSVDTCCNKHHAKGLCRYHYRIDNDEKWHKNRH